MSTDRLDIPDPAGSGSIRDCILHRRIHTALGNHGGESVRRQLLSFHRTDFFGAVIAAGLGLALGEYAPLATKRRLELLERQTVTNTSQRFNFAYAADKGRVYKVQTLFVARSTIDGITIERKGKSPTCPSYILTSTSAQYSAPKGWRISKGRCTFCSIRPTT